MYRPLLVHVHTSGCSKSVNGYRLAAANVMTVYLCDLIRNRFWSQDLYWSVAADMPPASAESAMTSSPCTRMTRMSRSAACPAAAQHSMTPHMTFQIALVSLHCTRALLDSQSSIPCQTCPSMRSDFVTAAYCLYPACYNKAFALPENFRCHPSTVGLEGIKCISGLPL